MQRNAINAGVQISRIGRRKREGTRLSYCISRKQPRTEGTGLPVQTFRVRGLSPIEANKNKFPDTESVPGNFEFVTVFGPQACRTAKQVIAILLGDDLVVVGNAIDRLHIVLIYITRCSRCLVVFEEATFDRYGTTVDIYVFHSVETGEVTAVDRSLATFVVKRVVFAVVIDRTVVDRHVGSTDRLDRKSVV